MADEKGRIPAWRRLGLALKNESQSGTTAPEIISSQSNREQDAPYGGRDSIQDSLQSPVKSTLTGKSSRLGKRKHQHDEPAETDGQATKKGKPSAANVHKTETTVTDAPLAIQEENVEEQTASSDKPPTEIKGDPNYRKKKAKPSKRRHREAPIVNHDGPFLSPDAVESTQEQPTLLASTETNYQNLVRDSTPQRTRGTSRSSTKDTSGSPSGIGRRKSVTFTPDTKRVDGNSAQNLFKKWVAEQKGAETESTKSEAADSASQPTRSSEIVEAKRPEAQHTKEKKSSDPASDLKSTAKPHHDQTATPITKPGTSKGKKKDPFIYIGYLTQYHTNRDQWKFNKAKQNDVIDNALNIFRIPDVHSEALLEYVEGLKGAGVIERLREKCEATLKEIYEEEVKAASMDNSAAREAMRNEALQARVAKERKRRKVDSDVEALAEHPHGDAYIRRMRRNRAEALLTRLARTAPILPATNENGVNSLIQHVSPVRDSKKRKRRTEVSSDESSSDSSSSDSSSSDSDSDSESEIDAEDSSDSTSSASNLGSGSDSDSSSNKDSSGDSESADDSDSNSNSGSDSDSDSD